MITYKVKHGSFGRWGTLMHMVKFKWSNYNVRQGSVIQH